MAAPENRTKKYARFSALKELLKGLTGANKTYLKDLGKRFSKVFLMGPHRSGSASFMQWLANTRLAAYAINMLSRFFEVSSVGIKIQQLLTDPCYSFGNDILDFDFDINSRSANGETKGVLAQNVFWYFWHRSLIVEKLDYILAEELRQEANLACFRDGLNVLANIFEKPFAMKAMIMNQTFPELADQFDKPLFIWTRRDPIFNIQSALEGRKRQHGDINTWYLFKIKEYPGLKNLDPLVSAAGPSTTATKSLDSWLGRVE